MAPYNCETGRSGETREGMREIVEQSNPQIGEWTSFVCPILLKFSLHFPYLEKKQLIRHSLSVYKISGSFISLFAPFEIKSGSHPSILLRFPQVKWDKLVHHWNWNVSLLHVREVEQGR